mmetsp:Transcript_29151/g.41020  ORF Transcript_29151/g.41020 Transcript_29151/m.41020 type:complete len:106 (-) Transcript_29151:1528-1845(-)
MLCCLFETNNISWIFYHLLRTRARTTSITGLPYSLLLSLLWFHCFFMCSTMSKEWFDGLSTFLAIVRKQSSNKGSKDVSESSTSVGQQQGTLRSLSLSSKFSTLL